MARIRSVKPELRTSKVVAGWPFVVRYFWVLLWGYLDDYGRGHDLPKAIAGDCFPDDEKITPKVVDGWLDLMSRHPGPVCRYQVDGRRFVHCVNWKEHQKPNRPTPSRIPPCPLHEPPMEEFSEPLDVGAAEQWSRGAAAAEPGEFGGEPPPNAAAAERLILDAIDCSRVEAAAIADRVRRERRPRNLPGLLRTIAAAGELEALLDQVRADLAKVAANGRLRDARSGPPCPHGEAGGDSPHPVSGEPICPLCRSAARDHPAA